MLSADENSSPYEKIYFGQVNKRIKILQKLEQSLKIRNNLINSNKEPYDRSF